VDKQILKLLEEDSRISYKRISEIINLSQPAVKERILKLVERDVITKFTIETTENKKNLSAFLHIKTSKCNDLEKQLNDAVEVVRLYRMSGYYNYCVEVKGENVNQLFKFQKGLRNFGPSQLYIITEKIS
jgi:DNA-binding Lrp family transcriptional regulator